VVSDASRALKNALMTAFPGSPFLSCYPHIIRKFKITDNRQGNGGYKEKLKKQTPKWLALEAEKAISRCSMCKTKAQKDLMWYLTKKKWEDDGEGDLARTFSKTYIHGDNFCNWYYSASGRHGIVPCNNPMERYNLAIKGSPSFSGLIQIGLDMTGCLTREFVKLIQKGSLEATCPTSEVPVVNLKLATNNNDFMEFQRLLDPSVDIREYGDGWLINDWRYLLHEISDDSVKKMELAMAGEMEENPEVGDVRTELLSRTQRFHFVTQAVWSEGHEERTYFQCDCREYFYHRWCFPSAYMQHRDDLRVLGKKFPNGRTFFPKRKKRQLIADALKEAAERKKKRDGEMYLRRK
jgi:hypothetical protein